ncbi:MAG: hypothetical protein DRQ55_02585 [Planctomycetota bacterium]|nr:MAG: hypothetical protein DRQ55_02585 [Planctomycetota bacterium]
MIARLLLSLMSLCLFAEGELSSAGLPDKDLEKAAKDVLEYYTALGDDERTEQQELLESITSVLEKSAKKAKAKDPLLSYLGDLERMLEFAKQVPREFKSYAGKGFFKHAFVETYDDVSLGVMLSLPTAYKKTKDLLPVIVGLKPSLGLSARALEDKVKELGAAMYGELLETHIIIIPLGPDEGSGRKLKSKEIEGSWSTDEGLYAFYTSFRVLLEQVRFDRSRVVLDGWREAGGDALRIATTSSFFGGLALRSAAIPEAGIIGENLKGVPVIYVAGAEDGDPAQLEALQELLKSADAATVVADEGSSLAPSADTNAAFGTWLEGVRKDLAPKEIHYKLGDIRFQAKDWCKAGEINRRVTAKPDDADFPRLHAVADRESNRIEIETVNIFELEVFLSDALVDMSKKVTIVVNGETLSSRTPRPSLRVLLDNRYYNNSQDYGLYTDTVLVEDIAR